MLEDWEKLEIISTVISIATEAMFGRHYYTFCGKTYQQLHGGPIGVRGTCAVARLWMQLFDCNWEDLLGRVGIKLWLNMRYMDDGRSLLQPIRPEWRWVEGDLVFCRRWELAEKKMSPESVTKGVLLQSLNMIDGCLKFTIESPENFNGWLPTLDTNLRVDINNEVQFKFYKNKESAKMVVYQFLL